MKIYVLWAGLLLAGVVSCLPSIDTDYVCDGKVDGYHCASCLQPVYCNSSLSTPATVLPSCDDHYACEEFSSTVAGCTHESTATTCSCSNSTNICDPYTDSYLAICISQSIVNVQDCGEYDECHFQQCMDQPSCAGVPNGNCVHDPTYCDLGYLCSDEEVVQEFSCPAGTYASEHCSCLTPAAPCSDFCVGNCPDETNCHQYYVCDGLGNVLSGPLVCPSDSDYYYFNPNANPPDCDDDYTQCSSLSSCGFVYN